VEPDPEEPDPEPDPLPEPEPLPEPVPVPLPEPEPAPPDPEVVPPEDVPPLPLPDDAPLAEELEVPPHAVKKKRAQSAVINSAKASFCFIASLPERLILGNGSLCWMRRSLLQGVCRCQKSRVAEASSGKDVPKRETR
jgi:outer membrane biosynthesis protein TonB